MIFMSTLSSIFFLGGTKAPFEILEFIPGGIWLSLKIAFFLFLFVWVRATLPRYRYDQLMRLGWKVFLPLTLAGFLFTASLTLAFEIC